VEPEADAISESAAREIAQQLLDAEDGDLSQYRLVSSTRSEDGAVWWVHFELPPPTPPGGHLGVRVDAATGEAILMPGE